MAAPFAGRRTASRALRRTIACDTLAQAIGATGRTGRTQPTLCQSVTRLACARWWRRHDARRRPPGRRDRAGGRGRGGSGARCARDRPLGARIRRQRDSRPGQPLPAETLAACREADAVLLAAVGLPELEGQAVRPEQGLLGLRKELGVYANLRPARAPGIDMMIVRELVGGLYFGAKGTRDDGTWFDTCEYSRPEVERIARRGFEIAAERGGRLTSVDKVNVMHTSRLWRDVVSELGAAELPRRAARSCARRLVRDDDRAGAGDDRHRRDGEHVRRHPLGRRRGRDRGPRPRRLGIARRRRPRGSSSRSTARRRRSRARGSRTRRRCCGRSRCSCSHGLGRHDEAAALERAVDAALVEAPTPDLGGTSTTSDVGDAVLRALDAARTL